MSDLAAAVARLLGDDGRCPPADPPGGRWRTLDLPQGQRLQVFGCSAHALVGRHRHVPSTSERGAASPRRPAPGTSR